MKKLYVLIFSIFFSLNAKSWWDPGHLVTAMIAYHHLNPTAKKKVDELTQMMKRDYPYVNHFAATSTWPDDVKAEGVRSYNTWHYTNIPYNPKRVSIPDPPEINIVWAIEQAESVLRSKTTKDIDKARHLSFLVHFAGDIHQPLHSTTMYSNSLPGGNAGGNGFPISSFGKWRNLHQVWDDGCGYLSDYNDINPYGKEKLALEDGEIERLQKLAVEIMEAHPEASISGIENLDRDFWILESHKLAIAYGYKGVQSIDDKGWKKYIKPNDPPSEYYLEQGQKIVQQRLAMGGYRLARLLNEIFPEE